MHHSTNINPRVTVILNPNDSHEDTSLNVKPKVMPLLENNLNKFLELQKSRGEYYRYPSPFVDIPSPEKRDQNSELEGSDTTTDKEIGNNSAIANLLNESLLRSGSEAISTSANSPIKPKSIFYKFINIKNFIFKVQQML